MSVILEFLFSNSITILYYFKCSLSVNALLHELILSAKQKQQKELEVVLLLTSCSELGWFGTRGFNLAGESKVILLAASARESELVLANLGLLDLIIPDNT